MNIVNLSDTAKSVLDSKDYDTLMSYINNRNLNKARLFIEDKIDDNIFSTKLESVSYREDKMLRLKKLDNIITNELINNIDIHGTTTISK